MDYKVIARDILENVGGAENVKDVSHCFTRLRLVLRDNSKANKDVVEKLEGVIQVVISGYRSSRSDQRSSGCSFQTWLGRCREQYLHHHERSQQHYFLLHAYFPGLHHSEDLKVQQGYRNGNRRLPLSSDH